MKLLLTFDLELFFGEPTGSVEHCMVKPTQHLLNMAEQHGVKLNFFWDVGHYLALQRELADDKSCQTDIDQIEHLLGDIAQNGHDIQLHIHPHWEKAQRKNGEWQMDMTKAYRLHDYSEEERKDIFKRYVETTRAFAKNRVHSFRAGGWCIQPFNDIKPLLIEHDITYDSSVMRGAKLTQGAYFYDFTKAPKVDVYPFENDVCKAVLNGRFIELPISTNWYSPFFFWQLYVFGRLNKSMHRPIGDGNFIKQPGVRNHRLLYGQMFHASTDGYFAKKLLEIYRRKKKQKAKYFVTIGHPKSITPYALKKMGEFIGTIKSDIEIVRFSELNEVD